MDKYTSPQAKVLSGDAFGFAFIDRLSTISVKMAQTIDWHRHDEIEILCCLKGSLKYEFRHHAPVTLVEACFMVIPSGIEHRLVGGVDGPCRRFSFFVRKPTARESGHTPVSTSEMRELIVWLLKKSIRPHIIGKSAFPQVVRLANILDSTHRQPLVKRLTARSDSLSVILSLATAQKKMNFTCETRVMDEAVKWLQNHSTEQVTIDQLIAYMGYSRSWLFHLFKSHTGLSPIEWLIRCRLEKAKNLLTTTERSVGDIARCCGFHDSGFFARTFRRHLGTSPTDFRANN